MALQRDPHNSSPTTAVTSCHTAVTQVFWVVPESAFRAWQVRDRSDGTVFHHVPSPRTTNDLVWQIPRYSAGKVMLNKKNSYFPYSLHVKLPEIKHVIMFASLAFLTDS